ncbi:MAG: hypothetical protein GX619_07965 [Bacteroidales bacterium]|jgi:hypothetical protein|nr:hypothetical protein [Bacteroidales bacterium]
MRKHLFVSLSVFLLLTSLLGGCKEEITAGQAQLRFSVDTLSFDTLFSGIGSTTAWVTVYNTDNRPALIDKVSLLSGGTTGFRFNLNGDPGPSLTNIRIPAGDSLFLFVELTSTEQGEPLPVYLEDVLVFESGTNTQTLHLDAWTWDAIRWNGKTILTDTTLTGQRPILLYDSLVVAENVTLSLQEGTTLYMHDGARVLVYGRLDARGSLDKPVTFRGDRLDEVFIGLPYAYYPGQWYYIQLKATSFDNVLDHVHISGGYYGLVADSSSTDRLKLTLTNSVVHNHVYNSLFSVCNKLEIANTALTNSGEYTVFLLGGEARFTHCTLANHMGLISRDGPTLVLANALLDSLKHEVYYPLQATFSNCLIAGSQTEEIGFAFSENESVKSDVLFSHSLLRSTTLPIPRRDSCLRTVAATRFLSLGEESNQYVYDFRIDSLSPARNLGSRSVALEYPFDLAGRSRLADEAPDAGAYEATAKPTIPLE